LLREKNATTRRVVCDENEFFSNFSSRSRTFWFIVITVKKSVEKKGVNAHRALLNLQHLKQLAQNSWSRALIINLKSKLDWMVRKTNCEIFNKLFPSLICYCHWRGLRSLKDSSEKNTTKCDDEQQEKFETKNPHRTFIINKKKRREETNER
jgi:hypothetical protein